MPVLPGTSCPREALGSHNDLASALSSTVQGNSEEGENIEVPCTCLLTIRNQESDFPPTFSEKYKVEK